MNFLLNLFKRRTAARCAPPAAAPPPPRPEPVAPRPDPAIQQEDCVTLPLKAITDLFPAELKGSLHKQPSEHVQVQIPCALIRPQLATGAVRITFAQLRAATPEIFFSALGTPPDARILLPLENVLRQMTPSRRDDQRQPSIPVNIPSIFVKTDPARANGAAARGSAEPWYSQRRPAYQAEPEHEAVAPAHTNGKKNLRQTATPTSTPKPAPAPPVPSPAPVAVPPNSFALPLTAVLAALPPEVRHALNGADAKTALFRIPLADFDARMRTGKLVFKWSQLREWCSVQLSTAVAPDQDIDLPLAAVVPLFMATRGMSDPRKQVEVDSRIPDVFAKTKAAPPAPPEPPAPPAPAAPVKPMALVSAVPPAPAATGPAEIVARLRTLEGVAGAFIATGDGLLIAGNAPDANENVLAAFAPTAFAQLSKYAEMARLGLPESVDIHLGNGTTMHVRKAGKLYVGVLVAGGAPLPVQELTRISKALQPHAS